MRAFLRNALKYVDKPQNSTSSAAPYDFTILNEMRWSMDMVFMKYPLYQSTLFIIRGAKQGHHHMVSSWITIWLAILNE